MAEEITKRYKLWTGQSGRIAIDEETGKILQCLNCPCCVPRVIAKKITNGSKEGKEKGMHEWDLTPYKKPGIGTPGNRWYLRDVGESHWNDQSKNCSGSGYGSGIIDENGVLVGLEDKFTSGYSYNGYMQLLEGCPYIDQSGRQRVKWTCPNMS